MDAADEYDQRRATFDRVERLVGSIVILSGHMDFLLICATAYAEHPDDPVGQEQRITGLYGNHGGVGPLTEKCETALKAWPGVNQSLRDKLVHICGWYRTTYEARNRHVHDAWVFKRDGDEYKLARVVTEKNATSSTPTTTSLDDLQSDANDMAQVHWMTAGYVAKLGRLAGGTAHPVVR